MSDLALAGRRVLVVGLARSGKAAAEVLVRRGAEVVGFDRDESLDGGRLGEIGVELHLGREEETLLQGIDLVVKSPGVPGESQLVAGARRRGIPVWSEIELGACLLPNPILGVTGTNGKTTTSELLGAVFRAADRPVEVAGDGADRVARIANAKLQLGAALLGDHLLGLARLEAVLAGERRSALSGQQVVPAVLEHGPGDVDRVLERRQCADGARAECAAVHHRGVELEAPGGVEDRSRAGVAGRVVLEDAHRLDDRIEGRPTLPQ